MAIRVQLLVMRRVTAEFARLEYQRHGPLSSVLSTDGIAQVFLDFIFATCLYASQKEQTQGRECDEFRELHFQVSNFGFNY